MEFQELESLLTASNVLNPKEAKLYFSLLKLKIAKTSAIARLARVGRQESYYYLEGLKKKGIVRSYQKNNLIFYEVADPNQLKKLLEQKNDGIVRLQNAFSNVFPEIIKEYQKTFHNTSYIKLFQGPEGFLEMYYALYRDVAPGQRMLNIVAWPSHQKNYMSREFNEFLAWRKSRKIWIQELRVGKAGFDETKQEALKNMREVRILTQDIIQEGANIEIGPKAAVLAMYDPDPQKAQGILFSNFYIINIFRMLFHVAWEQAKPL